MEASALHPQAGMHASAGRLAAVSTWMLCWAGCILAGEALRKVVRAAAAPWVSNMAEMNAAARHAVPAGKPGSAHSVGVLTMSQAVRHAWALCAQAIQAELSYCRSGEWLVSLPQL